MKKGREGEREAGGGQTKGMLSSLREGLRCFSDLSLFKSSLYVLFAKRSLPHHTLYHPISKPSFFPLDFLSLYTVSFLLSHLR